jgi:hypothetical protein
MHTCLQNPIHLLFIVFGIVTFKIDRRKYFLVPKGFNKVFEAKLKTIFQVDMDYGISLSSF